jgi:hypothetical protein
MKVNEANIETPVVQPYAFKGGEAPTDPKALIAFLAARHRERRPPAFARAYEKQRRIERMFEQAKKSTRR